MSTNPTRDFSGKNNVDDGSVFVCLRLPDGREVWVDDAEVEEVKS